jgi:peptide/nickel transport system permease protein
MCCTSTWIRAFAMRKGLALDPAGVLDLRVAQPRTQRSGVSRLGKLARSNAIGTIGAAGILILIVVSALAPLIAPYPPTAQIAPKFTEPSWTYIMGTDDVGRDVFSRLVYGARVSLWVGVVAVTISTVLGVTCGVVAGYFGGVVDNVLMRLVDILLAFPGLILAIIIAAYLGPSLTNAMIAIGIVGAPHKARIARAPVLSILTEDYIVAARVLGAGNRRLITRHVLPNAMAPLIVSTSLSLSAAILADAGLSFLGLGTQPPNPSWGAMLQEGRRYMEDAWWMAVYPGLAIMLAVLSFNLLGDGLRDILDPRLRGTHGGPDR